MMLKLKLSTKNNLITKELMIKTIVRNLIIRNLIIRKIDKIKKMIDY